MHRCDKLSCINGSKKEASCYTYRPAVVSTKAQGANSVTVITYPLMAQSKSLVVALVSSSTKLTQCFCQQLQQNDQLLSTNGFITLTVANNSGKCYPLMILLKSPVVCSYSWAIQQSWFARVNALCNLSCKTL